MEPSKRSQAWVSLIIFFDILAARSDILAAFSTAGALPLADYSEMETGWDVEYLGHFPGMGSMSVALLQYFEVVQSQVAERGGRSLLIAWSWCSRAQELQFKSLLKSRDPSKAPRVTKGFGLHRAMLALCLGISTGAWL